MFKYNISKHASNSKFKSVCGKIEGAMKDFKHEEPIIDVDGSVIKIYSKEKLKIKIYNDYEVDAVYVDSDVDLTSVLKDEQIS